MKSGIPDPESISDHMYRMAMMAMTLPPHIEFLSSPGTYVDIDKYRCVEMALVHDLAESIVGDITPNCGVSVQDKHAQESMAMDHISDMLRDCNNDAAAKMKGLFLEYEEHLTSESKVVHDLDKLEMVLQAQEYERRHGVKLESFFTSTRNVYQTKTVHDWDHEVYSQR